MGICCSYESTGTVASTAKLILDDGRLEEFSYPVRVAQILEKNPSCFVCKADDMEFDGYVSAVNGEEELQLGHLYFALPVSWLKSKVSGQEMAALAVKASLALKKLPVEVVTLEKGVGACPIMAVGRGSSKGNTDASRFVGKGRARVGGGVGGRRRKKFTSKLSAITED